MQELIKQSYSGANESGFGQIWGEYCKYAMKSEQYPAGRKHNPAEYGPGRHRRKGHFQHVSLARLQPKISVHAC